MCGFRVRHRWRGSAACLTTLLFSAALAGQRLAPPPPPSPSLAPLPPGATKSVSSAPLRTSLASEPVPPKPDPLLALHDLNVGTFYFHRGDYVGALSRFQDAIANDPDSPEPYCRAGDTENKLKHRQSARDDWQRCLLAAADSPRGKWARAARKALSRFPANANKVARQQ